MHHTAKDLRLSGQSLMRLRDTDVEVPSDGLCRYHANRYTGIEFQLRIALWNSAVFLPVCEVVNLEC